MAPIAAGRTAGGECLARLRTPDRFRRKLLAGSVALLVMQQIAGSTARAGRVIAGVAALACLASLPEARGAAAGYTEVPELALDLQAASDEELLSRFRLGGDADLNGGRLRLTKDAQSQAGWMWSRAGTPARMEDEWSMEIDVQLHGKSSSLSGDGMAIWLATRPLDGDAVAPGRSQSLGPNFGMPSRFAGLGLFLDTFDNAPGRHSRRFPYVAGVFMPLPAPGQPEEEYAHNAPEFAHAMDASQGCTEAIRATDPHGTVSERTVTLRLEYEGPPHGAPRTVNSGILSVSILPAARPRQSDNSPAGSWRHCFVLRGVRLPAGLFLGASASTGDLTDAHEIDRVRVFAPDKPVPRQEAPGAAVAPTAAAAAGVAAGASKGGQSPEAATATANGGDGDAQTASAAAPVPSGPFCGATGEAEVAEAVLRSPTVVAMQDEVERMGARMEAVGEALSERLASGLSRLEETLLRLGRAEEELDARLQALADRTAEAEQAAKDVVSQRGGWFEVALVLVVAATAVAGGAALFMACTASERLEKPHSL